MNDEHVFALVETIDGAHLYAIHQLALDATFIDDIGQMSSSLWQWEPIRFAHAGFAASSPPFPAGLYYHRCSLSGTTAEQIGLPQLPIVKAVRDVFKALYDHGHERWDHSAFLLYLEKMNAPTRLGNKANTPPER
jgi:3-hydroxyisobutyrate dehydrogenase-like beta-hydroxyacid dehydrogenase